MSKYMKTVSVVVLVLAITFAMGVMVRVAQDLADREPLVCPSAPCPDCQCSAPVVVNPEADESAADRTVQTIPVPTLQEGQVLPLPGGQWISIARPDLPEKEEFGDSCVADERQRLVVLRVMSNVEALVRYESTEKEAGGAVCRNGTLGLLDVADYALTIHHAAELAKQRLRVEAALKGVTP